MASTTTAVILSLSMVPCHARVVAASSLRSSALRISERLRWPFGWCTRAGHGFIRTGLAGVWLLLDGEWMKQQREWTAAGQAGVVIAQAQERVLRVSERSRSKQRCRGWQKIHRALGPKAAKGLRVVVAPGWPLTVLNAQGHRGLRVHCPHPRRIPAQPAAKGPPRIP